MKGKITIPTGKGNNVFFSWDVTPVGILVIGIWTLIALAAITCIILGIGVVVG